MRVIFRPAALLMEPFSSARLFFFPLPGAQEWAQGMMGKVPLLPVSGLPSSPCKLHTGTVIPHTKGTVALLRSLGHALSLCTCDKVPPIFDILQHGQWTPTMFTGFSAALGGTAVIHAQAVRVRVLFLLGQSLGKDTDSLTSARLLEELPYKPRLLPTLQATAIMYLISHQHYQEGSNDHVFRLHSTGRAGALVIMH